MKSKLKQYKLKQHLIKTLYSKHHYFSKNKRQIIDIDYNYDKDTNLTKISVYYKIGKETKEIYVVNTKEIYKTIVYYRMDNIENIMIYDI